MDQYNNIYYFVKLPLHFISLSSHFVKILSMVILAPSRGLAASCALGHGTV